MVAAGIDWARYLPSEETNQFASTARKHFTSLVQPAAIRGVLDGSGGPDLWPALAEHGYTAIGIPEELDGAGSFIDLCAVLEQAGRSLLPAPLLTTAAAAQTLRSVGALEGPPELPWALALPTRSGQFLAFDAQSAHLIVTVVPSDGGTIVTVSAADPNGTDALDASADPSRRNIRLTSFGDERRAARVPVEPDTVLAAARTCFAADLLGIAAVAFEASLKHVMTRHQFGRPIGSFQAVKHLLVDAYVSLERARSLVLGAAVEVEQDPLGGGARRLAMLAKAAAGDAATGTTALRTQLLGAMGLTFESDSHLGVRRAQHTVPFLGTSASLYARAADDARKKEVPS